MFFQARLMLENGLDFPDGVRWITLAVLSVLFTVALVP